VSGPSAEYIANISDWDARRIEYQHPDRRRPAVPWTVGVRDTPEFNLVAFRLEPPTPELAALNERLDKTRPGRACIYRYDRATAQTSIYISEAYIGSCGYVYTCVMVDGGRCYNCNKPRLFLHNGRSKSGIAPDPPLQPVEHPCISEKENDAS